jgi:hypothetical protein
MLLHDPASKTNPKLVRTHSASIWCWDKPRATLDSLDSPWPGLGGSHHLPPYSILCVTLREPHPNGTFSRDSQGGVRKLFRVELPGLWTVISPGFDLWLEWGLNQSCSSPQELFNASLHSFCKCQEEVDSRLLVAESQTVGFTPGPSFAHNLSCRCPNGSCKPILGIYTSRSFQQYKENFKARCFSFCCQALKLRESRRTPSSHFWECESHPHTLPKVGLWHRPSSGSIKELGSASIGVGALVGVDLKLVQNMGVKGFGGQLGMANVQHPLSRQLSRGYEQQRQEQQCCGVTNYSHERPPGSAPTGMHIMVWAQSS